MAKKKPIGKLTDCEFELKDGKLLLTGKLNIHDQKIKEALAKNPKDFEVSVGYKIKKS